jgi:hypothetical protein
MHKCKITKLAETVWPNILADIPFVVYGKTGIGKSSVIKNDLVPMIEREYGPTVFHDTRMGTKQIEDGTGLPVIDKEQMATLWTRPAFVPFDDGKMHVFFYDEAGHATIPVQQMLYSITLDRALGGYAFPKQNRVILATNTRQDGGGDNKFLKPLDNRIDHYEAEIDTAGLIEKMKQWGWDSRLIAFLSLRPGEIHNVSATDPAFPTPRSCEALSKKLKFLPSETTKEGVIQNQVEATVGEGFTRQFMTFLKNVTANLPRKAEILANPKTAKVPQDPHFQYVVASMIAKELNHQNADKFCLYLERLMPDIRAGAAHDAIARDSGLRNNEHVKALAFG